MPRHYELFLACRYLKKKRLAFFSIAAVALSVAMLIVVSSVTGGFVKQFSSTCHDFYGDIIVRSDSLMGFPYYDELIDEALKIDGVQAASPVIKQFGLLRIDQPGRFKLFVKVVNILGIDPESYSKITKFKQSLWKHSKLPGPPVLDIPKGLINTPDLKKFKLKGACIVGVEVPYNRRPDGTYDRKENLYNSAVILTMVPLKHTGMLDMEGRVNYAFLLIDDSETSVLLVDEQTVYISFDIAQQMSRMAAYQDDDTGQFEPARASQVQIRTRPDADLQHIRRQLQDAWYRITTEKGYLDSNVVFETWDEQEGVASLIAQLSRDRSLMTVLFGIMGIVSIFLIFCIFFVIVTEKIPDIGIIKSVGGSGGFKVKKVFFSFVAPWMLCFIANAIGPWRDLLVADIVLRSYVIFLTIVMLISSGGLRRLALSIAIATGVVAIWLVGLFLGWNFTVYLAEKATAVGLFEFGAFFLLGSMFLSCRFRIPRFFFTLVSPWILLSLLHYLSRWTGVFITDQIPPHFALRVYAIFLIVFAAIAIGGSGKSFWAFVIALGIAAGWLVCIRLAWSPLVTVMEKLSNISITEFSVCFLIVLMAVSKGGVGRIFLAYGAAVGIIGALSGLTIGWLVVTYIEFLHDLFAQIFGWRIYDPSVLLFPNIPNKVDWPASRLFMRLAIEASLVGAMIPAIRAALMKPIKALRYE